MDRVANSAAGRLAWLGSLFLCALILNGLVVRWSLVHRLPFIMDELADIQLGIQTSRGEHLYANQRWERTPLMTYLIGWFHDPADSSFEATISARRMMWVHMLAITLGTVAIAWQLFGLHTGLLAGAMLLAFSNFLGSSIQVRSDVMTTAFVLPALWAITQPKLSRLKSLAAGLALGIGFVTTQKAIYYLAAYAVAVVTRVWLDGNRLSDRAKVVALHGSLAGLGFALPLAIMVIAFWRLGALIPMIDQVFLLGAQAGLAADTYRGTWVHVPESLGRNPGFWLLGVTGAGSFLMEAVQSRRARSTITGTGGTELQLAAVGAWVLVLMVLYAQHTSKFPYVFINLAPALAICGAAILARAARPAFAQLPTLDWRALCWTLAAVATLIVYPAFHTRASMQSDLLDVQRRVMDRADALTAPTDAVFDGIGIATTRRKATPWSMMARWFDERAAGADYEVLGYLVDRQPTVMIWNYRLPNLRREELEFIGRHFVHDWANIWVVGAEVEAGGEKPHVAVNLLSTTDYAVTAPDVERVRIDGYPITVPLNLAAGEHVVTVLGEPQRVTLQLARSVELPFGPPRAPYPLFLSYSAW